VGSTNEFIIGVFLKSLWLSEHETSDSKAGPHSELKRSDLQHSVTS